MKQVIVRGAVTMKYIFNQTEATSAITADSSLRLCSAAGKRSKLKFSGGRMMSKFRVGDTVRWFLNPSDYIIGTVVEVCKDGTYWVEYNNGQQRRYKERELSLHDEKTD